MEKVVNTIVTEPLKDFFQVLIAFLPNLISSIIIFVVGLVAGWILRKMLVTILNALKTDRFCEKVGITQGLEKIGIRATPTVIVGRIAYWLVVIIFIIIALHVLKVPVIVELLKKLFVYLPNIAVAFLLILVGYLLGNVLGRAALIASVNAGIRSSSLLANGVKTIIVLIAFAMALEQLGIGRETVIVAFTIIFGGIVFALALAFGLGGRDIAKDYLEKRLRGKTKKEDDDEFTHI